MGRKRGRGRPKGSRSKNTTRGKKRTTLKTGYHEGRVYDKKGDWAYVLLTKKETAKGKKRLTKAVSGR